MFEAKSVAETIKELQTDAKNGLNSTEAAARLNKYGRNVLKEEKKKSLFSMLLEQLNEPLIFVLFVAAAISMLLREFGDTAIILVVIGINAVTGVVQEGKAIKAMEALKKMSAPHAIVRRDGRLHEVAAETLVPGDVVVLEAGRRVPADLRLTKTASLKIEEASLTGESIPVEKEAVFIANKQCSIGDCKNMAFMSTNVTYGRGEGVVTATAMDTQIGKIAGMISQTDNEMTPLQKRLADLGKLLSVVAVVLCILLFLIAILQHRNIPEMLITAISLAVAAVPEGLPAVVTIVLALSVSRMVRVNTIVRRLPCVETLGCVSVVCSDKTGTLTENRMKVKQCYTDLKLKNVSQISPAKDEMFLKGFSLCNDAVFPDFGDPTELALLAMGDGVGLQKKAFEQTAPRIGEIPFDSTRKMMTTIHQMQGKRIQFTKGSADELLKRCTHVLVGGKRCPLTNVHRADIGRAMAAMADDALRVLGIAMKENVTYGAGKLQNDRDSHVERDLTFLGLAGMEDPPRPEVYESVSRFKSAGVRTVMITGDHMDTAFAIARQLGIADEKWQCMSGSELERLSDAQLAQKIDQIRVFARVSPKHKVRIVQAQKKQGNIVAMTGDGVNDAPSLKAADIGIAMGKNGTDVARSAADIVLTDDKFSTIEKAIEEGRGIYENIKKSVLFLLSSNFGEIMTMFAAIFMGIAAPLKATHILWINLMTDSLPALALGIDKNDTKTMMSMQPRHPKESLFAGGGLALTLFYGSLIASLSLAAFLMIPCTILRNNGMEISVDAISQLLRNELLLYKCQTYAFTVLGVSQLFHALGMRNMQISIFRIRWSDNILMIGAFVFGLALQVIVTEIPYFIHVFGTSHLTMKEWGILLGLSAMPVAAHEIMVLIGKIK